MTKFKRSMVTAAALMFFTAVLVTNAVAAEMKIGFVNMAAITANSDMGKRSVEELKKSFDKQFGALQKKDEEIGKMRADLEKQRGVIKKEAFHEKELELQKKMREFQAKKGDVSDEFQLKQQEKSQEILTAIYEIVQEIGKKEGYTLIVDVYSLQPPYFDKDYDLTERVVKELNKKR